MGPLSVPILALALVLPAPSRDRMDWWAPIIAEASQRFDVPAPWIERVISAESGGNNSLYGRPIRSAKGAMGLMQLMPATWADMRSRLILGSDPDNPRDNILAGTLYLRLMYDRFGYPGLFAAYNAGPSRYAASLTSRRPIPAETMAYVAAVTGGSVRVGGISRPTSPTNLFVVTGGDKPAIETPVRLRSETAIFVIRK